MELRFLYRTSISILQISSNTRQKLGRLAWMQHCSTTSSRLKLSIIHIILLYLKFFHKLRHIAGVLITDKSVSVARERSTNFLVLHICLHVLSVLLGLKDKNILHLLLLGQICSILHIMNGLHVDFPCLYHPRGALHT